MPKQPSGKLAICFLLFGAANLAIAQNWEAKITPPPARTLAGMAYDSVHGQLVLFGGMFPAGGYSNETWLFDGWKWTQANPTHVPAARTSPGMAFDSVLQKVVMAGGAINSSTGSNDTWTWNGSDWTQLSPATSPSAMQSPVAAYDTARSRMVLFGNGQTWEWNGTNWTQRSLAVAPPARTGATMAYDAQRGYMVLMGGVMTGNNFPNDTWTYDGNNWTLVWVSSGSAAGRFYAAGTYDADRREVVIFGGGNYSGSSYYEFNDTWAWDGAKWVQLMASLYNSTPTQPTYRLGPAMAYFPARHASVMYGGQRSGLPGAGFGGLDDTWTWDGTAWTPLSPVNREAANIVWDTTRNHAVMFGGWVANWAYSSDSFDDNGTWIWDGASWQVQNPAHKPQQRREFAMAYDAAHDQVLIFGGSTYTAYSSESDLSDMWAWNGADWTQLKPATLPSARHGARMVYDAFNQRVVLFGGTSISGGTNLQDTWIWNGATWTQLSPATVPPKLTDFGMAYDPVNRRVAIAGSNYAGAIDASNNWTSLTAPFGSLTGQMVYDAALSEMVFYDGQTTRTFDGATWGTLTTTTTPPNHPNTQIVYDPVRSQVILYGGGSSNIPIGDTWALTAPETTGDIYVASNLVAASYSIAGPSPQIGSGVASHWSGAAPGVYQITFGAVAGYVTPATETFTLTAGSSIGFTGAYAAQPGAINVSSNVTASFNITGAYNYSGTTPFAQANVPAGTYTIRWAPVVGTATPADQTQSLPVGGSITFTGAYTMLTTTCSLSVSTNLAAATFSVVGPASYFGAGTSYSQAGIPCGTYTIAYNAVAGYAVPASQTTTVSSGTLTFSATYQSGTPAANPGWVLKAPALPWGRGNFSAVYDAARNQVVMFGGTRGADTNETWVYDGANWTRKHPCHSPGAQQFAALAYDSVNQKVVLSGRGTTNRETWTWDGTDWTQLNPANSPPYDSDYPPAAYDAARQQTVLVNNSCSETWVWDGTTWTKKSPATALPGTFFCSAAYDAARSQVVLLLFREVYTTSAYGYAWDTWTWDGTNWTQRATGTTVTETYAWPPLTYDPVRQQVVWFDALGVTWTWNGSAWTQRNPANSPGIRQYAQLVADPAGTNVLLIGGIDSSTYVESSNGGGWTSTSHGTGTQVELSNDVWVWDGSNWTERSATPSYPVRVNDFFVNDDARGEVVLFSGSAASGRPADTWIWNGSTWIQRDPANSPPPRFDYPIAYDAARRQVVIFGGNGNNVYLGDTWVWDGVNWTQKYPTNSPTYRRGQMMAYDAAHSVTVMFGGTTYDSTLTGSTVALNDTWTWDGTNWTQMNPAHRPPAREQSAMIYDPVRGKVVLFGGHIYPTGANFGDTWVWDGTDWTQMNPVNSPSPRGAPAMAFDTLRGYAVLFGGSDVTGGYEFVQDTWTWDGTNWTQQSPADMPPGTLSALTYDSARGQLMFFGGWTASQHYFAEDVWVWDQPQVVPQTGGINVATNLPGATFSVTGPTNYSGSGTSWWQTGALVGQYSVSFNPVAGYITPSNQVLTLASCSTIDFAGTYKAVSTTGTIAVTTNLATGSFTITGPATYYGSGTSWSQVNAPVGQYTIVFNAVSGYTTPASQVLTLGGGVTLTFCGIYVGIPVISSVVPNAGRPGQQNLTVNIAGQFTDWAHGATTVDFGDGITVDQVTVNSDTSLTVIIDIASNAAYGPRTVTVNTIIEDNDPVVALVNGFFVVTSPSDAYRVRYAANLTSGIDSVVNIINTGANGNVPQYGPGFGTTNGGNMCVNVYALDPDEELISCCSCLLTPNQVVELNVHGGIMANTLHSFPPASATIKLLGSSGPGTTATAQNVSSCTNSAATVTATGTTNVVEGGYLAFGTTVKAGASGSLVVTETPFLPVTLSLDELTSLTTRCAAIIGNGTGYGVCAGCTAGGAGAAKK